MRKPAALVLLALAAVAAAAQTPAEADAPPGLSVVKHSWSKERVGWEQDPFGGPVNYFDQVRMRARNEQRIENARRAGDASAEARARTDARADEALIERTRRDGPPRYAFLYKVSLMNSGAKAIKEVDWDYVFFDSATGEEVGRHQFTSEGKVEPGKRKEFSFLIPRPPSKTVSLYALNDKERHGLAERVLLVRVRYADGTVWQHP